MKPPQLTFKQHLFPLIRQYTKPYLGLIFFASCLSVLYGVANVLFLPLTRDIIKEITSSNLLNFSNHVMNAIGLYSIRVACQYSQHYLVTKITMLISIDIRAAMYDHLLRLPQKFYAKWKLGDVLTRLGSDSEKVRESATTLFFEVVPNMLTFLGVLGYLMYLNYKLTLFTITMVPLFVFLIVYLGNRLKRLSATSQQQSSDISHILQENLSNVKLVQAYGMQDRETHRFRRESTRVFATMMKSVGFRNRVEGLISVLQFLVIVTVIWFGGYQIANGDMDGATLASFFTGIFLLIDPVLTLSKIYGNVQQSMASLERMMEIMNYDGGIHTGAYLGDGKPVVGAVVFNNVSFTYPESERPALATVDLVVNPGEIVALVGLSGAGKTSLINLIPRFYDVTDGQILLDDRPLQEYDLAYLRSQIAIVPQEDILFRGSFLENIRYGSPKASIEDVTLAAQQANAWEFIQKRTKGLYAHIGDRGGRLSGGQKQRISIARAILRNPRILILDEATSALDSKSEQLVQEALNRLMLGRTTFVIAHRLSTVRHAHKIVVMSEGKIVEVGTHEALIVKGAQYHQLYRVQFGKQA